MSWRLPDAGDWVAARRQIPITLTDHVLGTGVAARTKGVVIDRVGTRLTVDFATGGGLVTATVSVNDCVLIRRQGGYDPFRKRVHLINVVRMALAGFLLWPVAWFVVSYLWQYRTTDGLVVSFAEAAVDSVIDWLALTVQHPVQSLLYLAFLTLLGKIAFPR